MENKQKAQVISNKSSEIIFNQNQSELLQLKNGEFKKNQVLCATCSHDEHLKFQHKRIMCHHRRKAIRMRQGHSKRLPILCQNYFNRFPSDFCVKKMHNQSNRASFANNDVTVTKMWHV